MQESEWGTAMRKLRKRLGGISQAQLADRLRVHVSTLRKWEQGRTGPSKLALRRINHVTRLAQEARQARRLAQEEGE